MTNKEASYNQEHMVAKFLGWKVVSGSGSRPFRPGDVQNDNYLVECKTHTKEQNNIVFYKNHWEKIVLESRSVNKYPALIVDDGTQSAENTWVMLPRRIIPEDEAFRLFNLTNTSRTDSTVTFNHSSATNLFRLGSQENRINLFPEWCNGEQVAIMPLSEFKKFYQEQFES